MEEIWRQVPEYEGYYEVSNTGRVRSMSRAVYKSNGVVQNRSGREKQLMENEDGYLTVKLSKNGHDIRYPVHVIVAKAFVPGYAIGLEVNHKDCNRKNNQCNNLEWVTHRENINYCLALGRHVSQTADYFGVNNPNFGNDTLHKKYAADPALSKIKQSRPGAQNGRARCVKMVYENGQYKHFEYIKQCADFLVSSGIVRCKNPKTVASKISEAIHKNKAYYGLRFELL